MANYTLLRCPYCRYIWTKRAETLPVSCPRCKKRFDYPGNAKTLEEENGDFDDIKGVLEAANRISFICESLEETMEKC